MASSPPKRQMFSEHSTSKKQKRTAGAGAVTRIINVRLLRGDRFVEDDLWIRDGKIIDPQARFWAASDAKEFVADNVVDGTGCIVAPGFIDVQINGAFGIDFSSPTLTGEQVDAVCEGVLQHGVTSFLATVVTSEPKTYREVLPKLAARRKEHYGRGAQILGLHLEGPFINKMKKGAHAEELIAVPANGAVSLQKMYGSLDGVSMVTIAPELEGSIPAIEHLVGNNVVVAAGHSMAEMQEAVDAVSQGVTMITHLFNAMSSFHHRDPGLVGLLGSIDKQVFYSLIADGVHAHPASVNVALKSHPEGLILVTDAMCAMGLPPGKHLLGTLAVDVRSDKAVLAGTETLAGSIVSMITCVQNLIKFTKCDRVRALQAASLHPSKMLGLRGKGTLDFGSDADFVILSDDLEGAVFFHGSHAVPEGGNQGMRAQCGEGRDQ